MGMGPWYLMLDPPSIRIDRIIDFGAVCLRGPGVSSMPTVP